MIENPDEHWNKVAAKALEGRTIKKVSYMTKEEAAQMDWHERPVVLELDDGTVIYPSRDDEGNGGGSLFMSTEPMCLPVIR